MYYSDPIELTPYELRLKTWVRTFLKFLLNEKVTITNYNENIRHTCSYS